MIQPGFAQPAVGCQPIHPRSAVVQRERLCARSVLQPDVRLPLAVDDADAGPRGHTARTERHGGRARQPEKQKNYAIRKSVFGLILRFRASSPSLLHTPKDFRRNDDDMMSIFQ